MYILDNNIVNILVYPSPARARVLAKINAVGREHVWISVIAIYEKLFHGHLPAINNALNSPKEVRQFADMQMFVQKLCEDRAQILPFTDEDYRKFKAIFPLVRKAKLDCRIAASALTREWTAITHDKADFHLIKSRVPDLKFEDWSIVTSI